MGSDSLVHRFRSDEGKLIFESNSVNNNCSFSSKISKPTKSSKAPNWIETRPVQISFKSLALTTATCQISALIFCLAWSIRFHFHESTATHCSVTNYLPSLSATLDFTPQRDVWRTCIGVFGLPRYFIAYLYYRLIFRSRLILVLTWAEITSLIGLSIVDSIKYFEFHATCVGIFLCTSLLHMSLVCTGLQRPYTTDLHLISKFCETKKVKIKLTIINCFSVIFALYMYMRHNRYCESGAYTLFSFSEYIVITTNIIYHLQAYHDLGNYSILVSETQFQQELISFSNNNSDSNNHSKKNT